MNRRNALGSIVAATAILGSIGVAGALSYQVRWSHAPTLTVIAPEDDPRVSLVRESVDYWNRTFAELGSSFRLGELTVVVGSIREAELRTLGTTWRPRLPPSLERYPGDIFWWSSQTRTSSHSPHPEDNAS